MARTRLRGMRIGDLRIAVEVPPALPWTLPDGEAVPTGGWDEPDLRVGVRVAPVDRSVRPVLRPGASSDRLEIHRARSGWRVLHRRRGRVEREARFDPGLRQGEVRVDPESALARNGESPLASPLDEWLVGHRLALDDGLLLHAAGAVRDGVAMLFAGPEKAGVARLLARDPRVRLLSDRRVAVRAAGTGFRAHATPWGGGAPGGRSARLDAVHLVHVAPAFSAGSLTGCEAVVALHGSIGRLDDLAAGERALRTLERLVERVPVVRLGCPDDADALARLVEGIWGGSSRRVG